MMTMTTTEITLENLSDTIAENSIVLIDFWAAWCGPCRMFAPVFEKAATEHPDILFGKVDTEAQQQLAAGFRITSIPTLMAFRDGILVFSQPGALGAPQLAQVIDAVRALDMDDIRAQIEVEAAPTSSAGTNSPPTESAHTEPARA
jgi:thioredoxin 1